VVNFSNLIPHRDKIESFKKAYKELDDKKIELEAAQKILKSNESKINLKALIITISIILIFCSLAAFYYAQIVLALLFLAIVIVVFAGQKFLVKENSLLRIRNELNDLNNNEDSL